MFEMVIRGKNQIDWEDLSVYEYVSNQCSSTKELKDSTIKTKEMKLLAIKINQLSPIKGDTKSDIEFKNYTKQKKKFSV